MLQWFLKDGRVVSLKGDEGRILLDGREVASVELSGGRRSAAWATTWCARRAPTTTTSAQIISAPGAVEIAGRAMELAGTDMEVDVEAQRLTLHHHVSMRVQPALLREQGGGHAPL